VSIGSKGPHVQLTEILYGNVNDGDRWAGAPREIGILLWMEDG